jgi:hypothetical protein
LTYASIVGVAVIAASHRTPSPSASWSSASVSVL